MANKPNRSPESIEQRRQYARERSRRRYREEKEKVLEEIARYKEGETYRAGEQRRKEYNKQYHVEKTQKKRQELLEWTDQLKASLCCAYCGFSHPGALDFHHKDPNQKEYTISRMISCLYSKDRILEEISKCTVLCANCHRILHYKERKSSEYQVIGG